MGFEYSEDRNEIYSQLRDLKASLMKMEEHIRRVETEGRKNLKTEMSDINKEVSKMVRIMSIDVNDKIDKSEKEQKHIVEMVRELGTAYQAELIKLGTKFTMAVSIFTLIATVILEVMFGHLLSRFFM